MDWTSLFKPEIVTMALAAAVLTKGTVDLVKMAAQVAQWVPPAIAGVAGPIWVLLLLLSAAMPFTAALVAQAVIAGELAAFAAVGATEMQKRALPGKE